jgi:hypothetical protein
MIDSRDLTAHRFAVGDHVRFQAARRALAAAPSTYLVVRQLPIERDQECRYRIKSIKESFERVAAENELSVAE